MALPAAVGREGTPCSACACSGADDVLARALLELIKDLRAGATGSEAAVDAPAAFFCALPCIKSGASC
jgi:hypothetical protein